jgi:hypothetical protein
MNFLHTRRERIQTEAAAKEGIALSKSEKVSSFTSLFVCAIDSEPEHTQALM